MRLVKYLQGNEPDVLLISVTQQVAVKEVFQSFLLLMEQVDLHLMVSPTRIHLGSINGKIIYLKYKKSYIYNNNLIINIYYLTNKLN